MAIYFKDKEITNIDSLIPQTGLDITDIWFGNTNVYTVWQVYEGTLPATFNANGDVMRQYQVWGAAGGVGDRTVQLFDKNATDTSNGYAVNRGLYSEGATANVNGWNISEYIPISANQYYVFKNLYGNSAAFCIYDSSKQYIWGEAYENRTTLTFNSGDNASYIRFNIRVATNMDTLMLTPGTTPPETFVPFGHKLPMVVFGGYQIYDDTLPAQISANGMNFKNYKIFGAVGGVGDRTVQLFTAAIEQGSFITTSGQEYNSETRIRSKFEDNPLTAGTYTIDASGVDDVVVYVYDIDKQYIQSESIIEWQSLPFTFTVSANVYVRFAFKYSDDSNITPANISNIMLTPGTTPPEAYVPDGYEVDIGVKSGNLLSFDALINAPSGKLSNYSFSHVLDLTLKPNTTYTAVSDGAGNETETSDSSRSIYINDSATNACVFDGHPVTVQTGADGVVKIGIQSERQNAQQYINGTAHIWLVEGSYALPYQPYSNTTIPIYIGANPLEKDEYIDCQAGKVFKLNSHNMLKDPTIEVGDINYINGFNKASNVRLRIVGYIDVTPNTTYCISYKEPNVQFALRFYAEDNEYLDFSLKWLNNGSNFQTPDRSSKIRCIFQFGDSSPISANDVSEIVLNEGQTTQPYFQPTDPPVPLPALPTVEGETIVDYAGQSTVPSRFYGKYINSPILSIYIGSDPLGEDEYVDYQAGKVFRRTVNLLNYQEIDYEHSWDNSGQKAPPTGTNNFASPMIAVVPGRTYLRTYNLSPTGNVFFTYDAQKNFLSRESAGNNLPFTVGQNVAYITYNIPVRDDRLPELYMLTHGSTPPETHTPYLQPTDPPVPLPALPTCEGTTIVDYAGQSQAVPEKVLIKCRKEKF